jgi:regulation of enolase protein 1 (concanavalin A-like superfamily)
VWTGADQAVRIMQSVTDSDFEVEAKFNSAVDITAPYQEQGIVVEQDTSNYIRFSVYSDNLRVILFGATISGSSASIWLNQQIRGGPGIVMRVKRTGSAWNFSYSYDSFHWTPAFTFNQSLQVAKMGPYAANGQFGGGSAPAFTAIVDHFINRATPPATVDGNPYPPSPVGPAINVWYGDTQTFGQNGIPQQWVNILGDVTGFDQVTSLTYSLNAGAAQTLWMGENPFRLVAPGEYNVEIDYASLSSGANTVQITATDTAGRQATHTVTVNYVAGKTWPSNYTANWSTAGSIQSVAQIVDGQWQLQSGAARNTEMGYDRLITIGDRTTWNSYTVNAEVTLNALDRYGFAVGIIVGWQGHTTLQYGQPLPDQPRTGHPFPGLFEYSMGNGGAPNLNIYENTPSVPESVMVKDNSGRTLQLGTKYIFKCQVAANTSGGSHYSFKVWPASSAEPANWDLQTDGELSRGSIILAAHMSDVSFGTVTITGQ